MAAIDYTSIYAIQDRVLGVLEYRLSAFPLDLLDLLHVKNQDFLAEMKRHYPQMRAELLQFF
jgi:hypothetical protein